MLLTLRSWELARRQLGDAEASRQGLVFAALGAGVQADHTKEIAAYLSGSRAARTVLIVSSPAEAHRRNEEKHGFGRSFVDYARTELWTRAELYSVAELIMDVTGLDPPASGRILAELAEHLVPQA